jgi:hypothetical protein
MKVPGIERAQPLARESRNKEPGPLLHNAALFHCQVCPRRWLGQLGDPFLVGGNRLFEAVAKRRASHA